MRFPRTFQIEKSRWVYSTVNDIKHISRHIIMKFLNTGDKEETPKCSWEQTQVTHKGSGIRITLVSSTVILKAERQNISTNTKKKWFSTWNSIPKGGGRIKEFSAIQWMKKMCFCVSQHGQETESSPKLRRVELFTKVWLEWKECTKKWWGTLKLARAGSWCIAKCWRHMGGRGRGSWTWRWQLLF